MTMRNLLAYILIGAIIGIAVFGFALVSHTGMGAYGDCIATTINGAVCLNDPVASAIFHITAMQFFSTATFTKSAIAAILLLLLFEIAAQRRKLSLATISVLNISFALANPSQIYFRHWLALHELSPPDKSTAR